jgi:hypothetical protein
MSDYLHPGSLIEKDPSPALLAVVEVTQTAPDKHRTCVRAQLISSIATRSVSVDWQSF